MPTLLSLPAELRTAIHELALTHDQPLSIAGIYPDYHGPGATTPLTRTHLALTQVSAQIRAETLPIFYSANTFTICLQPVYVTYTRPHPKRPGQLQDIYKRSYGDYVSSEWFKLIEDDAVRAIRTLRVYVACVTRWEGDEVGFEREKCDAYGVVQVPGASAGVRAMAVHVMFDMCSGSRVFNEVDLERRRVEGFVEVDEEASTVVDEDVMEEEVWGGNECEVCLAMLRRWLGSVDRVGGKKRVTKAKMAELVW